MTAARETVPVLPGRRPRERLPLYAEAALRMDYAVRNTRVLIRRAAATIRRHGAAPARAGRGRGAAAEAVRALGTQLTEPGGEIAVRRAALRAAATATSLLREDPDLSSVVIVGQIRSTAIDLLRGSGLGAEEARRPWRRSPSTTRRRPTWRCAPCRGPGRPPRPTTTRRRSARAVSGRRRRGGTAAPTRDPAC